MALINGSQINSGSGHVHTRRSSATSVPLGGRAFIDAPARVVLPRALTHKQQQLLQQQQELQQRQVYHSAPQVFVAPRDGEEGQWAPRSAATATAGAARRLSSLGKHAAQDL